MKTEIVVGCDGVKREYVRESYALVMNEEPIIWPEPYEGETEAMIWVPLEPTEDENVS